MSDEHTTSAEEPSAASSAGSEHTDAWHDVIGQLDALGEAMGRWAKAAVNDPVNRDHADELKEHMNKMADTVSGAVDDATKSDMGQQFKDAAYKTGEALRTAGERVGEEVTPRVASAFRITAEKLQEAAERMERSESEQQAAAEPAEDATPSDETPDA